MLFRKNDGSPQALPFQDADSTGRIWTDLTNNEEGRVATGWVQAPAQPSYDPATEKVVWQDGEWAVVDLPPAPEDPTPSTLVAVALWFLKLTNDEVKAFNLLQLEVDELTAADYADPAKQHLVYWGIFLTHFARLDTEIDLGHPQVQAGMALFQALIGMSDERLEELMTVE